MSLDYPILPICQTAESFRNILSAMGPYRDSISLKKSPLLGLYTGSEAQLDLATVRYHALGAYAKSVYLVIFRLQTADHSSQVSTKPGDDGASDRQGNAMVEPKSGKNIDFHKVSRPGIIFVQNFTQLDFRL